MWASIETSYKKDYLRRLKDHCFMCIEYHRLSFKIKPNLPWTTPVSIRPSLRCWTFRRTLSEAQLIKGDLHLARAADLDVDLAPQTRLSSSAVQRNKKHRRKQIFFYDFKLKTTLQDPLLLLDTLYAVSPINMIVFDKDSGYRNLFFTLT